MATTPRQHRGRRVFSIPREFFPQFIAVGQMVAPALAFRKRIFEGLKLPFFRLADRKRLVDCHIAVDHRRTLGGE